MLSDESRQAERRPPAHDLLLVIGDGLSSHAVHRQSVGLISALLPYLQTLGISLGPVVLAHQSRVALGDDIGETLGSKAVAILIGERPGLSSPDSLGVYLTTETRAAAHWSPSATAFQTFARKGWATTPPPLNWRGCWSRLFTPPDRRTAEGRKRQPRAAWSGYATSPHSPLTNRQSAFHEALSVFPLRTRIVNNLLTPLTGYTSAPLRLFLTRGPPAVPFINQRNVTSLKMASKQAYYDKYDCDHILIFN